MYRDYDEYVRDTSVSFEQYCENCADELGLVGDERADWIMENEKTLLKEYRSQG